MSALRRLYTASTTPQFILILSDLSGIPALDPILATLSLLRRRKHRVVFLTPHTPWELLGPSGEGTAEGADPLHRELATIYSLAEYRQYFAIARELYRHGIPMLSYSRDDTLPRILQRLSKLSAGL